MRIEYKGSQKWTSFFEYFNIGLHKNKTDSDYFFVVTLFGREFVWFIYK